MSGPATRGRPVSVTEYRSCSRGKLSASITTIVTAQTAAAATIQLSHAVTLVIRTVECTTAIAKTMVASSHSVYPRDWSGQSPAAVATTTHANSSPSTGAVHRSVVTRVGRDRRRASSTTSASIGT